MDLRCPMLSHYLKRNVHLCLRAQIEVVLLLKLVNNAYSVGGLPGVYAPQEMLPQIINGFGAGISEIDKSDC